MLGAVVPTIVPRAVLPNQIITDLLVRGHSDPPRPPPRPYLRIPPPFSPHLSPPHLLRDAAVAVLQTERRLLPTGEICRIAIQRSLIKCQGKTPEATMASALYTDVKRKGEASVFTRPYEGLFGLK